MKKANEKKHCLRCEKRFTAKRKKQVYCHPRCAKMAWWDRQMKKLAEAKEILAKQAGL